jgi:Ca2+-binding EF-hand superfamily protein
MDGGGGGGEGGLGASEAAAAAAGAAVALGAGGASGGALDGSLTEENLEMLAMAFTKVDVGNTGYIPADPNALTFILATLNIERPRDEDLEGLLVELVQDTPQEEEGRGGEEGPRISFQAFVKALATIKE